MAKLSERSPSSRRSYFSPAICGRIPGALSVSALRDTTEQWNHWSAMLASSADLALIVEKGNRSLADVAGAEALRYGAFVQAFFDTAENYHRQIHEHKIERNLAVLEAIVARRLSIGGFADWWKENTCDYDPAFVGSVESVRASVIGPSRSGQPAIGSG